MSAGWPGPTGGAAVKAEPKPEHSSVPHGAGWEAQLAKLRKYRRKHGDCNVPQGWAEDPPLGSWVNKQRARKKALDRGEPSEGMTAARAAKLEALGFAWALSSSSNSAWAGTLLPSSPPAPPRAAAGTDRSGAAAGDGLSPEAMAAMLQQVQVRAATPAAARSPARPAAKMTRAHPWQPQAAMAAQKGTRVEKPAGAFGGPAVHSKEACPDHDLPCTYFCETCAVSVCSDCALFSSEHKGHDFKHLRDVYADHAQRVEAVEKATVKSKAVHAEGQAQDAVCADFRAAATQPKYRMGFEKAEATPAGGGAVVLDCHRLSSIGIRHNHQLLRSSEKDARLAQKLGQHTSAFYGCIPTGTCTGQLAFSGPT